VLGLTAIYRGFAPFLLICLTGLVLITYVPDISLTGMRF
jgi:TRAP-type C4-dicarboxylate transport system permease large subunit